MPENGLPIVKNTKNGKKIANNSLISDTSFLLIFFKCIYNI